jgi:fibronectin-binding autotransporter adhesin
MLSMRNPGPVRSICSGNYYRIFIFLALILFLLSSPVSAAVLTWDPEPVGAGITDGSGTWDTMSLNWTTDGGTTRVAWTNGDDAIIGGGTAGSAGTITGGGVQANSITCNLPNGGGSYTITGGKLTLSGNSVNTNAQDLKISSVIGDGTGLTKTGTGKLTLSGVNTDTGTTTISGGTL